MGHFWAARANVGVRLSGCANDKKLQLNIRDFFISKAENYIGFFYDSWISPVTRFCTITHCYKDGGKDEDQKTNPRPIFDGQLENHRHFSSIRTGFWVFGFSR